VSWQIVAQEAETCMNGPDKAKARRVGQVMLSSFGKPDLTTVRKA
jgi:hypothetical protein